MLINLQQPCLQPCLLFITMFITMFIVYNHPLTPQPARNEARCVPPRSNMVPIPHHSIPLSEPVCRLLHDIRNPVPQF